MYISIDRYMYLHVCIYVHICIYVCVYISIDMFYVCVYVDQCMCVYISIYRISIYLSVSTSISINICVSTYTPIFSLIDLCMCRAFVWNRDLFCPAIIQTRHMLPVSVARVRSLRCDITATNSTSQFVFPLQRRPWRHSSWSKKKKTTQTQMQGRAGPAAVTSWVPPPAPWLGRPPCSWTAWRPPAPPSAPTAPRTARPLWQWGHLWQC